MDFIPYKSNEALEHKYYQIPQKYIENTEHMCYIINNVSKNGRTYAMDNYMEDWIGIEAAQIIWT